jgi:dipeptidyl aminopeptidase/acylaminoacyl peptidase
MVKIILVFLISVLLFGGVSYSVLQNKKTTGFATTKVVNSNSAINYSGNSQDKKDLSPLAIVSMRDKSYPGSGITIEQTLPTDSNYYQFRVSYLSEGLKIYGLLAVPMGEKPLGGWPVILFNHGYIPPASYSTVSSYAIMFDPLARAGFIVFKPDYRGNGYSQGVPVQPYISPNYITDSMNALASIKQYKDANPKKIGVFGHSMGGNITLHELVMTHAIKAAEIMAGVVGNETDLASWWDHRFSQHSIVGNDLDTYYAFEKMIQDYDMPSKDPSYWNSIDPTFYLSFINAPIQIQVGSSDDEVPTNFSSDLYHSLLEKNKVVDYRVYQGADHNLAPDTATAMNESTAFFKKYLQ